MVTPEPAMVEAVDCGPIVTELTVPVMLESPFPVPNTPVTDTLSGKAPAVYGVPNALDPVTSVHVTEVVPPLAAAPCVVFCRIRSRRHSLPRQPQLIVAPRFNTLPLTALVFPQSHWQIQNKPLLLSPSSPMTTSLPNL